MSRKLQTLEDQYNSNPNLPNLIEYLEECKRESEWQTIIKVTEIRSGSETPEVHFYRGLALINLGKKKEGVKELRAVIAANPNHFAAKKELEKYADDNPDVGQIMPKVFYPDGRLQHLCKLSPTPMDLIGKRFLPKRLTRNRLNRFQLKFTGYNKIMNIPYLSGCFMFFNLEILQEIGLFDEKFFMYSEDVDITRRIHRKYRTIFYPNVSIYHVHNAASTRDLKMLRIHIVNMIKYFNKWGWLFDKERKAMNKETLNNLNY